MPKSYLRQQRFILFTMVVESLLNIVKGLKNLKKQASWTISIKMK